MNNTKFISIVGSNNIKKPFDNQIKKVENSVLENIKGLSPYIVSEVLQNIIKQLDKISTL